MIAHKKRVARMRKNENHELAEATIKAAKKYGYKNDYLAVTLPPPGSGHNASLVGRASVLRIYWGFTAEASVAFLTPQYEECRNPYDVVRAVNQSYNQSVEYSRKKFSGKSRSQAKFPKQIEGLADLIPKLFFEGFADEYRHLRPYDIIKNLFSEDDPFLNLAPHGQSNGKTRKLSEWKREWVESKRVIVPNPMKARTGLTLEGKESPKSNSNILRREHIVVEFDGIKSKKRQMGVLQFLSNYAPLKMVLFSGGKSIHGWFYCGFDEGQTSWEKFFKIACLFGADRQLATISQYCRIPNVKRDNGNMQSLLYFDPKLEIASGWDVDGLVSKISTLTESL